MSAALLQVADMRAISLNGQLNRCHRDISSAKHINHMVQSCYDTSMTPCPRHIVHEAVLC